MFFTSNLEVVQIMTIFTAPESIKQTVMTMKKSFAALCMLLCIALIPATIFVGCTSDKEDPKEPESQPHPLNPGVPSDEAPDPMDEDHIVVAYFTSWSAGTPDPSLMTHINYAFGHVSDSFSSIKIDNQENLRKLATLKNTNPKLKVLLSLGGWGSGGFSELCADENHRKNFAADCRRVVDEFGIDGIDIDWEYPGSAVAGISSSAADPANFVLLLKEIREALPDGHLLTLASGASGTGLLFKELLPYVDYINIMAYDLADPPKHHAPLFRTNLLAGYITASECVEKHLSAGVPADRLVLGIPLYGRGCDKYEKNEPFAGIIVKAGCTELWDDVAKAPYIVDARGSVVLGFENARSITCKRDYIKEKGLKGIMYWEYRYDDSDNTLRRAAAGMLKVRK